MAQLLFTWALIFFFPLVAARPVCSQEEEKTPSQKTREALERFSKFPSAVKKRLEAAEEKVKGALQDAAETPPNKKVEGDSLTLPKKAERSERPHYSSETRRDPFAPMPSKSPRPAKKPLSPLEQFELGQLKLVGIVWNTKDPRAMVEDSNGLGYTIKVGTPIGANDGKVKAINLDEVIIEEHYVDFYGVRKSREFTMKLPSD
jgi:type IV pilus assembly protein PilP